jgi:hypothetical protein
MWSPKIHVTPSTWFSTRGFDRLVELIQERGDSSARLSWCVATITYHALTSAVDTRASRRITCIDRLRIIIFLVTSRIGSYSPRIIDHGDRG